ncbi:hypothetical protein H920_12614 [Fukomys damarensis]|uniref:Uncharacterized protein n=1 Tax=Fukomys damarensis TaxID=885580 RepID=A0A091D6D0_FUKDA|nr:hypothetical protein H920_12614 [Fukomys damarensis]
MRKKKLESVQKTELADPVTGWKAAGLRVLLELEDLVEDAFLTDKNVTAGRDHERRGKRSSKRTGRASLITALMATRQGRLGNALAVD